MRSFNKNIFTLEFKSHTRSLIYWGITVAVVVVLMMAFFPSMQTKAMQDLANAKLEGIPDSVLAVLGLTGEAMNFTDVFYFFAYLMNYINMALAVYATLMGANGLIREESDGSIEYLYAQPVTRSQILISKWIATLVAYGVLVLFVAVISAVSIVIFADGVELARVLENILKIFAGTFFVGAVFMAIGYLGSCQMKNVKRTATFSIAAVFGTFVVGIMSIVSEKLDFLLYFSPLDTVKPNVLIGGDISEGGIIAGFLAMAIFFALSLYIYNKKDLNV